MEQNEKLWALETLQKKLYAYNCASNSLYLDAVTVAPKNTAEGRGVALSILAGELQKLMTAPRPLHWWRSSMPGGRRWTPSTAARWRSCAAAAGSSPASPPRSIWHTAS